MDMDQQCPPQSNRRALQELQPSARSCLKPHFGEQQLKLKESVGKNADIADNFSSISRSNSRTPKKVEFSEEVEIKNFGDTPPIEDSSSSTSEDLSTSMDSLIELGQQLSITPDLIRECKLNFRAENPVDISSFANTENSLEAREACVAQAKFRFKGIFAETKNTTESEKRNVLEPNKLKIATRSPNLKKKLKLHTSGIQKKSPIINHRPAVTTRKSWTPAGKRQNWDNPEQRRNSNSLTTPVNSTISAAQTSINKTPAKSFENPILIDQENTPYWWQRKQTPKNRNSKSALREYQNPLNAENNGEITKREQLQALISQVAQQKHDLSKIKAIQRLCLGALSDEDFDWAMEELQKFLPVNLVELEIEKREIYRRLYRPVLAKK